MNRLSVGRNRATRRLVLTLSASVMVLAVAFHGGSAFADDETGPADGCAPSLVNEGFFSRFADTYKDLSFNYFKDPANLPAY